MSMIHIITWLNKFIDVSTTFLSIHVPGPGNFPYFDKELSLNLDSDEFKINAQRRFFHIYHNRIFEITVNSLVNEKSMTTPISKFQALSRSYMLKSQLRDQGIPRHEPIREWKLPVSCVQHFPFHNGIFRVLSIKLIHDAYPKCGFTVQM